MSEDDFDDNTKENEESTEIAYDTGPEGTCKVQNTKYRGALIEEICFISNIL